MYSNEDANEAAPQSNDKALDDMGHRQQEQRRAVAPRFQFGVDTQGPACSP